MDHPRPNLGRCCPYVVRMSFGSQPSPFTRGNLGEYIALYRHFTPPTFRRIMVKTQIILILIRIRIIQMMIIAIMIMITSVNDLW